MINLLPPNLKQSYRFALRNVRLVRWATGFTFGLAGLVAISTIGLIYMHQSVVNYQSTIAASQASLKQQNLTGTQTQVTDMGNSLKLAVQVLSKEVLFSQLLTQLATLTPNNAILTNLDISQTQGAVSITAMTTDYSAATQLQVNLSDPNNKIFSHADINSIICNSNPSSGDPIAIRYPCTVTIQALFATNNPFLFINGKAH